MIEVKPITVKIDFPALDNLVDYLKSGKGAPSIEVVEKTEVCIDEAPKAVEKQKVVEIPKAAPAPVEPEEPDIIEEQTEVGIEETKYTPDQVSAMALQLRDINKENAVIIKTRFPEIGIKALSDIRANDDACQKLAKILIEMGAKA